MELFRKFLSLFLAVILVAAPVKTQAAEEDSEDYILRMIQYYLRYQEDANEEIAVLLDYLCEVDPQQGELWRKIMVSWGYHNSQMTLNQGMLPDGLPQDDSLCIVIMGYDLRDDGSMKEELIDRLVVGLSSALKYPNAYVAVTGGATSDVPGVTEAGQMAQWLIERGVSPDRIILETRAANTLQNATRLNRIFRQEYPWISSVAVVTSDYHIRQSCVFFSTVFHQSAYEGAGVIKVVETAVNVTDRRVDDLHTQAWGISAITGIPYDGTPDIQPELSE